MSKYRPHRTGSSDVVWDRRSEKTGLRPKNRNWSWSCRSGVVLWNMVLSYARRHNDLEGHGNFSSTILQFLYSVLGTSLLWRSTVAFTYLKVKSALSPLKSLKCLCLSGLGLVYITGGADPLCPASSLIWISVWTSPSIIMQSIQQM